MADSANPRVISTLRSQSSQASRHYKTLEMIQNIPSENFLKTLKKDSQAVIIPSVGPAQDSWCHVSFSSLVTSRTVLTPPKTDSVCWRCIAP